MAYLFRKRKARKLREAILFEQQQIEAEALAKK